MGARQSGESSKDWAADKVMRHLGVGTRHNTESSEDGYQTKW